MNQLLIFENPGEADLKALTTLGVNVKDGASPIGFFGTGFKFAVATALRLGAQVQLFVGTKWFEFIKREEVIRGKKFDTVFLVEVENGHTERLGFTTEMGKQWEPWMAYREFYCNALDEGASRAQAGFIVPGKIAPDNGSAGHTTLIISGAEVFIEAHRRRPEWALQGEPEGETKSLAVHSSHSDGEVFYRGIRVAVLPKPTVATYNIKDQLRLTEDRTVESWYIESALERALAFECNDRELLKQVLTCGQKHYEGKFDYGAVWDKPSMIFTEVVRELMETRPGLVNAGAVRAVLRHVPKAEIKSVALTKVEQMILDRALKFLVWLGEPVTAPIVIVDSTGSQWIHGLAKDGKIFLPKATFGKGTKYVASTLLEEHLHISKELRDESRELQDWLFDKVISMGEELRGEPL